MNLNLEGKSALVCGSTQGIGKAIAEELAHLGASVTLVARNISKLQEVKARLSTAHKQVHQYLQADFSNPAELKSKIEEYLKENASPEILVNNTGGPAGGQIIDEPYAKFMDTMTAHLECNHLLAQALVPGMKEKAFGRIINIISTSVYVPIPGLGVSNTVRGAVASWAKTLSLELGQFGITVNNVLPGFTDTVRLEGIVKSKAEKTGKTEEEVITAMKMETPARRFGRAEEAAAAAAFLASPAAAYVNGVSIPVDGGRTGCI
ncbi:3-oxoacyl-[acyl-carrier protein] reductase [Reichenbachiella faecimaris]|uniref:3-oxoacyl-[acyl-carrier protein] reductase n=1 Tax=Reichenbachiella faecimaris TaxID=692418 RepID=A0A1W2G8J4_REIFA|nr:SDR family oxidoreductase [Reichenbachiella faecimaris]SMD32648.1 3-oxoacyl-[acyl-carrier protein] reductase [Reichenbachiella faecimaris]